MNIIDQLKKNEKPYGLMSKEMQDKAREIGTDDFEVYCNDWEPEADGDFWLTATYRLRPDYQEPDEYVECEIHEYRDMCEWRYGYIGLYYVPDGYERIGFKFKHGKYAITPELYENCNGTTCFWSDIESITSGAVKVLHATHVVFRKKGDKLDEM
jgi:hypothetical protein